MKLRNPPRVLIPAGERLQEGVSVVLDPAESAHLWGPLRRRGGDAVFLVDGCGGRAEGVVGDASKKRMEVVVDSVQRDVHEPTGLSIALCVLHTRAMDWAVQKSVEIGVESFFPVIADRSQLGKDATSARSLHWTRVALQALKQSGRTWAMKVESPLTVAELVELRQGSTNFVAAKDGNAVFEMEPSDDALLLVGPEGGLSADEQRLLAAREWQSVRLGRHILRADTAAIVGAALMLAVSSRTPDES
ncbi:MAG: 16S rRNA (uracil(1498)-N(3))-methyltransferase [bacterium]|nr:16S rRNA (uracil(1498)-N(3))-methyltransferase [bacterium]